MPYIKSTHRPDIEEAVIPLGEELDGAGELNFAITTLILSYLGLVPEHDTWVTTCEPSYNNFNEVIGVLECVKQELYRRAVVPYEEEKRSQNGDVYSPEVL